MDNNNVKWVVLKESVRGASHEKNGLPNQDSIFCRPCAGSSLQNYPYIISVSDGHGSLKCFRSDKGSELAVFYSTRILNDLIEESKGLSLSFIKNTFDKIVIKKIHSEWIERTRKHYDKNPFREDELEIVRQRYGEKTVEDIIIKPQIAYGATLLLVAITPEYMIFLQNGDGDIIVVMEDGEIIRPLPNDPRLIANETTSLSSENAWGDFRTAFQVLSGRVPKLILLSSDGYANSFVSDEDFLLVGKDIFQAIRNDGIENVQANLKEWLNEASVNGSGDDVTLGILYRIDNKDDVKIGSDNN